jgi:rhamnosyltransferase
VRDIDIVVIIPTLNASKTLSTQLGKLSQQDCKVLVIDSSSSDDTVEIAKSFDVKVTEIKGEEFNHATTRNLALNYDADFYLFMTQDALPYDDKLVENLLKPFDDKGIVVSYARQVPWEDADIIEKFARETNYPNVSTIKSKESLKELGIKTFFCSNSCAMYRASYFKEVGGFTEGLIMNEDMEYVARAILDSKKIAYISDAKVWHSHKYNAKDIFKRYFDIGIFFKTNEWIQDEVNKYNSTESTGIKQAKKEFAYLLKKSPLSIPKSILFSLTKYMAYKLGYNYDKLPLITRKTFSLHKIFHN